MTNRAPKYRCLICAMQNRTLPTRGPRAGVEPTREVIRRPGRHSNHRHPGRVQFERFDPKAAA